MKIASIRFTSRQWTCIIFLLAIAVRIPLASVSYSHIYVAEAENIAKSIALRGEFSDPYAVPTGPTAHSGPFYPALLAVLYIVFGTGTAGMLARIGLVIVANSAMCAAMPVVARGLKLPAWCGLGAGLAAALIPMHRTAEIFNAWDEPYAALGLMLALAILARWAPLYERQRRDLIAYGLLWGCLLELAAAFLPVLLGLAICDVLVRRGEAKAVAKGWLVVLVVTGLTLAPWAIRNRVRLGGWILLRSPFGSVLYFSNNDGSVDYHMLPYGDRAEAERVRDMGEIAYNNACLTKALYWIQSHPGRFAELTFGRTLAFWFGVWQNPGTAWIITLTTAFGMIGAWLMWRDGYRRILGIFGVVWLFYPLVYYVAEYAPRYRVPIWWTVLLMGAYGAGRIADLAWRRIFIQGTNSRQDRVLTAFR